ncbi:MAG: single-stranded DNA-binding protein [Oscillospiraceae bacterium]|nr:single-stranded DNA-binding protein [Oscillospiraceae bacterium]
MLNQIVLMGRLVRDPEMRYTQSQTPVCSFRIAVDRDFGGRDGAERQTDFIDIVAWRQSAEFVSKYFTKGSMIIVVGRLQMRDWTDRDGNKRTSAEVQADRVMFGETRRSREENSGGNYRAPGQGGGNSYGGGGGYGAPAPAGNGGGNYRSFDEMSGESAFSELSDTDGELPF